MSEPTQAEIWEARYRESERVWSGRPNATLVDVIGDLAPGRALELACGEGADSIWLAESGWRVTAVDIAPTAVARAREHAQQRGVDVEWLLADLSDWTPPATYDLVTASFWHTPDDFPRTAVLRRVAATIDPGGHMFLLGHAEPPPWVRRRMEETGEQHGPQGLMGPQEEIDTLALGEEWDVVRAEVREREGAGPDGTTGVLRDSVVLLRRLG